MLKSWIRFWGKTAEHVYHALSAERWAYFLQNADKLTPEQLMLYNARLKFQRDAEARLQKAREDGIREGEARGEEMPMNPEPVYERLGIPPELRVDCVINFPQWLRFRGIKT